MSASPISATADFPGRGLAYNDVWATMLEGYRATPASATKWYPPAATPPLVPAEQDKPKNISKYISWSELLRHTFGFETVCQKCQTPLRLISLIKSEAIAKKILVAMHLPAQAPSFTPARPPPGEREAQEAEDGVN